MVHLNLKNHMQNTSSVEKSLGLQAPWEILEDTYDDQAQRRTVTLTCTDPSSLTCPKCGKVGAFYDLRTERQWRHLDTCTYQTILVARVPWTQCLEHGVKTVRVPWADASFRYTHDFEEYVIGWAKEASLLVISRQLGIGWKGIAGIQRRAVERGKARRKEEVVANLCVDEVAYHKCLTMVSNADTVLYVGLGQEKGTRMGWYQQ